MKRIRDIRFEKVHFSYGAEEVIREMSFSAAPGDHLVIKGESGSGKSTILKLLLGFIRPDSGRIEVGAGDSSLRHHTAWLPQDLDLGEGSVEDTMDRLFSFEVNSRKDPRRRERLAALQELGLEPDMYEKSFRDLSTGQRQRVGLAICRLLDKQVLLLDEPTSALDPASKRKAAELLLDNSNRITISTSHDPFWLERATTIVEVQ